MAAYLVGTRGTPLHAVGLGLSVTASHTLGILVLAALVAGSGQLLPTDVVVRATPVIAAATIVGIGAWMLIAEVRRRRVAQSGNRDEIGGHERDHGDHGHDHGDHGHEHAHGGIVHSHLPPAGTTITWRSLFALGLAGGLIPSVNALLILLGTMAAGRPAFGVVLVVAFGLGMALVMTGVGLAMVFARSRLDRLPSASGLGRAAVHAPLVAAVFVFGLGIWLTQQAVFGAPVF
jgi:ABC-type nickel/cobalt efflux system permease component RcnA